MMCNVCAVGTNQAGIIK